MPQATGRHHEKQDRARERPFSNRILASSPSPPSSSLLEEKMVEMEHDTEIKRDGDRPIAETSASDPSKTMRGPSESAHEMPSWTVLLEESKQVSHQDKEPTLYSQIQPHFRQFSHQIDLYGHAVNERDIRSSPLTKDMIVQTRAALRFATICLSKEETRPAVQEEAVVTYGWHVSLCYALAQQGGEGGDAKCRILMARLLSNLVTCNPTTATVVASTVPLSPSRDDVESRIRMTLTSATIDDEQSRRKTKQHRATTWVDMLVASSKSACREALAAIVAALYNCISSVPSINMIREEPFCAGVATDCLIINSLLRQMLPATSVTFDKLDNVNGEDQSLGDSATEWIVRTVEKLCRMGQLPSLLEAARGGSADGHLEAPIVVTPELIVLLHCVARAVEEESGPQHRNQGPFLGREAGDAATVASHVFLANTFCSLTNTAQPRVESIGIEDSSPDDDDALKQEAWFLILEMLASSLGTDTHASMDEARLAIGRDTNLVQAVSFDLGAVVDSLSATNQGRNARELVISNNEQRRITGLVQLIGNVCFRCRRNQDLVRETIVPFPSPPPGTTVCDTCVERTALHVLLSCTSFSYGCFTLREWAIVALRNVLEGNEANQALVEKLEAQQPMQSAELEGMGLRVDMDPDGKICVVPTSEQQPKSGS